jgi:transcriptional regulator with XRE-family HTH domain
MTEKEETTRLKKRATIAFGKHIIKLRLAENLTSAELAIRSNLTASNMSRIEGGRTNPTLISLIRFAHAFGLTLEGLMKGYVVK